MIQTNLEGLEYLNKENCVDYKGKTDIIEGRQYQVFNSSEFEYCLREIDYLQNDVIKHGIQTLVDFVGLQDTKFDFGNDLANKYFETLDLTHELESFLFDSLVYGSSYVHITVEDNYYTANSDDKKVCLYSVDPDVVYADYNEYNTQLPAYKYTIIYKKDLEKNMVAFLLVSFKPGEIIYQAFVKQANKEFFVDPFEYFPEFYSEDVDYQIQGLEYIINTKSNYSNLQAIQYNKNKKEFYGSGLLTDPIASKLNAINRLDNLAVQVVVDNSQPPLQLNSQAHKGVNQSIVEATQGNSTNTEGSAFPLSLENELKNPVSYANTYNYQEYKVKALAKKKFLTLTADGRGENKYISNPFDIKQGLELERKIFDKIMSDLYLSEVLYKSDLSTGAKSGVAIDRLMTKTIKYIENFRNYVKPVLQRVVFCLLETAKNANLNDTNYNLDNLPEVKFPNVTVKTIMEKAEEWKLLVDNNFGKLEDAVADINQVSEKRAKEIIDEMDIQLQSNKATQKQDNIEQDIVVGDTKA
jgi:hypothetical protein